MRPQEAMRPQETMQMQDMMQQGGHLYIQSNGIKNVIIHYVRQRDGKLVEAERVATGGAGSGTFKPISDEENAPNAYEAAKSVIVTPDRRLLFATNGGDNSVSSFSIGDDGTLTLLDVKRTGNLLVGRFGDKPGRSGTASSLAYSPATGTLYVAHSFGPDHIRLMSVDRDGKLTVRPEGYTVNTPDKPLRVSTMIVLSPDQKFLVAGTTFDEPAHGNPDGSPILWVDRPDGTKRLIASNAPDPDGLVVFPVGRDGALGAGMFQDGGSASPWYPAFLHHRPDHFIIGAAVGDGVLMATIDAHGHVSTGPVVKVDTSAGLPSELCWAAVSPDDKWIFATHFGYSYISTFRIDGDVISVAQDPACPKVPGDGTFRALNGTVSSGPADSWLSPDGAYLYQIYANASALIGYAVQSDGSLNEVTRAEIPYNSPVGLAGL